MKGRISIQNNTGESLFMVDIEGIIGIPEQMQFEERGNRISTYDSLRCLLDRVNEDAPRSIIVNIRSTGGSVSDALLIYDFLKSCGAEITTRCFGYAASAATIIAQAASDGKREISANCLYLIHNSSCETEGNRLEMESAAGMLGQTDKRIASIYALNSDRNAEDFSMLMGENGGKGRWLSPEEAIGYGLADIVINGSRLGRKDRRIITNLGLPPIPPKNSLTEVIRSAGEKIKDVLTMEKTDKTAGAEEKVIGAGQSDKKPSDQTAGTKTSLGERSRTRIIKQKKELISIEKTDTVADNLPCRSSIIQDDPREKILPTITLPKEDPSIYGQRLSRNEEAYMEDLRRIRSV